MSEPENDPARFPRADHKTPYVPRKNRFWPPGDTAISILGGIVILLVYPGVIGGVAWFWSDHRAVAREREKAVHQNAGEYFIDLDTFDKKFRYHQPVAAPTPFGRLDAVIPPWDAMNHNE